MNFENMTINKRFKYLRKDILNKTQSELANVLDMTHAGISKIENDKTNLTAKNIKIVCMKFNVSYDWLVYGKGDIFIEEEKINSLTLLAKEFDLDNIDIMVVQRFIDLSKEDRKTIAKLLFGVREFK